MISTDAAAEGAEPLAHSNCTIIKVNGDYRDPQIRNTEEELASYPPSLNRLLDQVFDEYGLIVCGWSAEWDGALRDAMYRCKSRRYTTYWTQRGNLTDAAQRLLEARHAEDIHIQDADHFFSQLDEHISSLSDLDQPHPLSPKLAKAAVKRYVVDEVHRIRLHDLVMDEANRIHEELTGPLKGGYALLYHGDANSDELERRLKQYEALSEVLCSIMATGCRWGEQSHHSNWTACLERLSNLPAVGGNDVWANLRYYPALLGLYAGGIAALAADRLDTLQVLLTQPIARRLDADLPLVLALNTDKVLRDPTPQLLPSLENTRVAFSVYLYTRSPMRELLREFLPRDDQFQDTFDRFEYLLDLVHMDLRIQSQDSIKWAPVGIFAGRDYGSQRNIIANTVEQEIDNLGSNWPPLEAGLFGGSIERMSAAKGEYDALAQRTVPY